MIQVFERNRLNDKIHPKNTFDKKSSVNYQWNKATVVASTVKGTVLMNFGKMSLHV